MHSLKTRRLTAFLIFTAVFIAAALTFILYEGPEEPRPPQLISSAQAEKFTDYRYSDMSGLISFHGETPAVDRESSTIYIYCPMGKHLSFPGAVQELKISGDKYNIYFPEDEYFADLSGAVRDSHRFRMIVSDSGSRYMEYGLIISPFPVISLEGREVYRAENGQMASRGKITLWGGDGKGGTEVFSSHLLWHPRGASSLMLDKKSLKCTLLNSRAQEKKAEILGMGQDDDWLLNAMRIDDLKLREQLFMALWNERAENSGYNYKMSDGKYAELIVNGSYSGLYLIQRQVEAKLLGLDEGDILIKGQYAPEAESIEDLYDIKNPGLELKDRQEIYTMLEESGVLNNNSVDNYMDTAAFLQFASALDNAGEKNMFYIVHTDEAPPYTDILPWDTDISFGIMWLEDIDYDYELSLHDEVLRGEYYGLKEKYPELDKMMYERWQELREGVLSEKNVLRAYRELSAELHSSGALIREEQRWGLFHGGKDSSENMERYLSERLLFLDEYYAEKAG